MTGIQVVEYEPTQQQYFEMLNRHWIEKYFEMEPQDIFVLTNPAEAILKPGGAILMALYDGSVAGTVALRKAGDAIYEFTKMAVDENFQRKGIAEALCYASFIKAKELSADKVLLFSNSILTPAIHLYEKIGFKHVPVGQTGYKRSDVKMVIDIRDAVEAADRYYSTIKP